MYIATIPNRSSPPAILLRESYRQDGKVKTRTLANLTHWPPAQREALRRVLRGDTLVAPEDAFEIIRSLPHGHVVAVLGTLRRLGLESLLAVQKSRQRDLVVAMIVARLIEPQSKLATARSWHPETALTSLGQTLGVAAADARALYQAMDWLRRRQPRLETALAKRHLYEGTLALYDLTSTYFEGHTCPLAQFGHSRDGKKGKVQIVFGLVCNAEGCPVAVAVFEGNTGDPTTVAPVIAKLRQRFPLRRVVLVGDRGLLTDARIREELKPVEGLDWITALRHPTVRTLVDRGTLDLGRFAHTELLDLTVQTYPDERLIACYNATLADERRRTREALLQATERELETIRQATTRARRPLTGQAKIALRVGKALQRFKVGKHFTLELSEVGFHYQRNLLRIAAEAALDGLYVRRTSVPAEALDTASTVRAYKSLATVERAFRSLQTVDLYVRPIGHHLTERVRAHVFLCMLAYYVEWHMRQALAPLLFDDDDKATAEGQRVAVVAPAQRSPRARRKAQTQHTDDGRPVHSFQTLVRDLGTITKNQIRFVHSPLEITEMLTTPTPLQQRALNLLQVPLKL
jgi:Transposase DDE domain